MRVSAWLASSGHFPATRNVDSAVILLPGRRKLVTIPAPIRLGSVHDGACPAPHAARREKHSSRAGYGR